MSSPHEETFQFTLEQLTIAAFFTLPERADDRLSVGISLLIIVYGLLANVALCWAVLGSKDLRSNPSYYLLIQIAVCDFITLLLCIFYHQAGIVFRQAFLGSAYSTLNYVLHFTMQCCWWTFVCALTFTAFNRFVCVVFVGRYGTLFTRQSTIVSVVLITIFGMALAAPGLTPCCKVLWLFDAWTSTYYPTDSWYIQFDFVFTLCTIGIIVFCYAGVLWTVRQKQSRSSGKNQRAELRIALQVGLMCGIYIAESIMWNVFPYENITKWVHAGLNAVTYVQCGIHPTISFVFNSRIRRALLTAMGGMREITSVSPASQATSTARLSIGASK